MVADITFSDPGVLIAAVVGGLILVFILARIAGGMFRAKRPAKEDPLREKLADYPSAPGTPGPRRVSVEGVFGRLRLVVVAPVGRERPIDEENLEGLIDQAVRGLREIIQRDKPRIKVWPPQLTQSGFANIFHRLVERPEPEGVPSRWVLVAGPARASGKPILLGIAVHADEPTDIGALNVTPERWNETVRVQTPS